MDFYIKKSSGELQRFDAGKFKRSLTRPGADKELVEKIIHDVEKDLVNFKTTRDIYKFALSKLKYKNPPVAARYNVKRAIIEFGPSGYPFEKYVGKILEQEGYKVKVNQIIRGSCIDHEVDLVVQKDSEHFMVECKFHNNQIYKTDVQVTLYTDARFHDIKKNWKPETNQDKLHSTWVFTNTRFSSEAIKYGNCAGMLLTGWDYPKNNNLAHLIDKHGMHPITALTSLTKKQKQYLVKHGLVLCRDADKYRELLKNLHLSLDKIDKIVREAELTCRI